MFFFLNLEKKKVNSYQENMSAPPASTANLTQAQIFMLLPLSDKQRGEILANLRAETEAVAKASGHHFAEEHPGQEDQPSSVENMPDQGIDTVPTE